MSPFSLRRRYVNPAALQKTIMPNKQLQSCIKLNNIGFAIQQLDKLESTLDVEKWASITARYAPPVTQRKQVSNVFTIKMVEAEDLKAMDINGASDPYVVVGDEFQKRLHKTRVIYANLNPRWEETIEITVQGPIWLTFTIWDWDTVGDHDCVGRTSTKLDPANFSDFLPKVCRGLLVWCGDSDKNSFVDVCVCVCVFDLGLLARLGYTRKTSYKGQHGG